MNTKNLLISWMFLMSLVGCKTTEKLIMTDPSLGKKIQTVEEREELKNQDHDGDAFAELEAQMRAERQFLLQQTKMIKPIHTKVRPVTPEIALTATIDHYQKTGEVDPILTADQMILYPYGLSKAKLVCGALHVCSIALQDGEQVLDVATGDSQRWNITLTHVGLGNQEKAVLMIKPLTHELIKTNLMITTDKRVYEIELATVTNGEYTPRIGFFYPQEPLLNQRTARTANVTDPVITTTQTSIENLNFNYKIKGNKRKVWYPKQVFDDGKKVYIQMSPRLSADELPIFMIVSSHGKTEIVNYRFKDGFFIVDKLFKKGVLILGTGRQGSMITITKKG